MAGDTARRAKARATRIAAAARPLLGLAFDATGGKRAPGGRRPPSGRTRPGSGRTRGRRAVGGRGGGVSRHRVRRSRVASAPRGHGDRGRRRRARAMARGGERRAPRNRASHGGRDHPGTASPLRRARAGRLRLRSGSGSCAVARDDRGVVRWIRVLVARPRHRLRRPGGPRARRRGRRGGDAGPSPATVERGVRRPAAGRGASRGRPDRRRARRPRGEACLRVDRLDRPTARPGWRPHRRDLRRQGQAHGCSRVLGESDLAPDDDAFRGSGLSHLLAVSGMHLILVLALAVRVLEGTLRRIEVLAATGDVGRYAAAAGIPLAWVYAEFSGAGGSTLRAAWMATAALAARALGRRGDATRAFGLSVGAMAMAEPLVAFDAVARPVRGRNRRAPRLRATARRPPRSGGRARHLGAGHHRQGRARDGHYARRLGRVRGRSQLASRRAC